MKRFTSFLLMVVLLLSLNLNVFAAGGATLPDKIDGTTVWSYLDDNSDPAGDPSEAGYNRTSWTTEDFNDNEWKTGAGGFGAKNGGAYSGAAVTLEGCPGDASNYPTYYFRTKVNVNKASAVTAIKGSISYDDAVIIYINGVKAAAFNEAGCDSNSSYSANKANSTDSFEITDSTVLNALKNGENVVAVEVHNHYDNSSDIWFAMNELSFSTDTVLLDGAASWKYLDNNTDPAGDSSASDYDRTAWTAEGFDTNLQYGGSNQGPDTLNISLVDLSLLHNGENTLAVELHNGRKTSSDVWFSFGGLYLSTDEVIYQNNISLSVGADESGVNFTWYSPIKSASVMVSENPDMTNGNTFAATSSLANDGQYSCKASFSLISHSLFPQETR